MFNGNLINVQKFCKVFIRVVQTSMQCICNPILFIPFQFNPLVQLGPEPRDGHLVPDQLDPASHAASGRAEVRTLKDIERFYHTQIEEMPMDIADLL